MKTSVYIATSLDGYIARIPVLPGSGIPLFADLDRDIGFIHIETQTYPNGLVKSHYIRG